MWVIAVAPKIFRDIRVWVSEYFHFRLPCLIMQDRDISILRISSPHRVNFLQPGPQIHSGDASLPYHVL